MRIELPWAGGTTPVEIDTGCVGGVLGADAEEAADPEAVLRTALATPGAEFEDFLAGAGSPLLVVVNDGTRPTPSAEVLAVLRPALEEWSKSAGNELSFVIATGTHRAALPEEVERILGVDLADAYADCIYCHNSQDKDGLVCLARTTRGTSVWVNRLVAEAESMVLINSVEPHYFAGYTGGRKSLFPGLAGYQTVWANHKLSMEAGSKHLVLAGNPVHEDLEEAMALGIAGKQVYSIQLVLDKEHRVGFVSAGSLEKTFEEAVAVAEKQFVLDLDRAYDVVVAAAPYPMDCNFYQTNKAIQSGALAVKDGGILIWESTNIKDPPTRTDIRIYPLPAVEKATQDLKNTQVMNMLVLGALVKINKIVKRESLLVALKDTLPERHHKLIPLNEKAIDMGMGLVEG